MTNEYHHKKITLIQIKGSLNYCKPAEGLIEVARILASNFFSPNTSCGRQQCLITYLLDLTTKCSLLT